MLSKLYDCVSFWPRGSLVVLHNLSSLFVLMIKLGGHMHTKCKKFGNF